MWGYPQVPWQEDFADPNLLRMGEEPKIDVRLENGVSAIPVLQQRIHLYFLSFFHVQKKGLFKRAFVLASQTLQSGYGLQV